MQLSAFNENLTSLYNFSMENRTSPEANQLRSLNRLRECNTAVFSVVFFLLVCHSVHKGIRTCSTADVFKLVHLGKLVLDLWLKGLLVLWLQWCYSTSPLRSKLSNRRHTQQFLFQYGAFTFVSFPSYLLIFYRGWWRWGRDYDDTSDEEQKGGRHHHAQNVYAKRNYYTKSWTLPVYTYGKQVCVKIMILRWIKQ